MLNFIVVFFLLVSIESNAMDLEIKSISASELDKAIGLNDIYHMYDYVVYAEVVENGAVKFEDAVTKNNGTCSAKYTELKVIESFKGSFKQGQIIKIAYRENAEYSREHSRQLSFIKNPESHDVEKPCDIQHYGSGNFLEASSWCCVVVQQSEPYLIIDDKINGKFLTKANAVFKILKSIK